MLVHGPNEEMRLVLVLHVILIALPELLLPFGLVLSSPAAIRLAHLPIEACQLVTIARTICATEDVPEVVGNLSSCWAGRLPENAKSCCPRIVFCFGVHS